MSSIDYGLLAVAGFFGSFFGAIAKDFYDWLKNKFKRIVLK